MKGWPLKTCGVSKKDIPISWILGCFSAIINHRQGACRFAFGCLPKLNSLSGVLLAPTSRLKVEKLYAQKLILSIVKTVDKKQNYKTATQQHHP